MIREVFLVASLVFGPALAISSLGFFIEDQPNLITLLSLVALVCGPILALYLPNRFTFNKQKVNNVK